MENNSLSSGKIFVVADNVFFSADHARTFNIILTTYKHKNC